MILLKEITIKNFLSHEKTDIKFGENEKYLIDGRSGSGKSSITEAILWCFYGKGRSDNRSLVRRGSKIASVSLKLIDGELETNITRGVSSTGKNTLAVTQSTGSKGQFLPIERVGLKDIQDWIEKEFLKASYELFTNSVAYPQENENSFVKATAARRKDLLLEIIRAGNFDDLYQKTRNAITSNQLQSAGVISKIDTLEKNIINLKIDAEKLDFSQKVLADSTSRLKIERDKEKKLENELAGISTLVEKLADKKSVADNLSRTLKNLSDQEIEDAETIRKYNEIDVKKAEKEIKDTEEKQKRIDEIENVLKENRTKQEKINQHLANKPQVIDYTNDLKVLNDRLIPLIKDSGSCPSGDKCPFVVPIKGQITFLTGQIEEKSQKSKVQKEALDFWEKEYATLVPLTDSNKLEEEREKLRKEISNILVIANAVINQASALKYEVDKIEARKIAREEEKQRVDADFLVVMGDIADTEVKIGNFDSNKINIELSTTRNLLTEIEKIQSEASNNIAIATRAADDLKNASQTIGELRNSISVSNSELESLELLKEALGSKGIKSVVVDYITPQLEERINKVLSQMSDFSIKFDTQQGKASGDGVKEGLFITIINDVGEELSINNLSGGEGIKVSMAISEGLASLMNEIGFRIVDEAVTSLDSESTESFVEVLLKLQEKFPQLLIISHLNEIKDIFSNKIKVIKVNGVSKIS